MAETAVPTVLSTVSDPTPTTPVAPPETGNGSAPPEPAKDVASQEPLSDKFAALARKEKTLVKRNQELSAMKAELDKQAADIKAQREAYDKWLKLKENAKIDPDSYLNEAGITYGFLTERALKGGQSDPKAVLEQTEKRISEWEKKQEDEKRKAQEQQQEAAKKEFEQRIIEFKGKINEYVETNKERFELIHLHGWQDYIFDVINLGAQKGQKVTVEEAASKVEQYMGEQIEKALTTTKRFKDKYVPAKKEEPAAAPKAPGAPTLNNSITASTPANPGMLTDKERMDRALAALNKAIGE